MKKLIRVLIITISSAVILYGVFVGVDCVRLSKTQTSKPPFVIVNSTEQTENHIKYYGLGYTVTYEIPFEEAENSEIKETQSDNTQYDIYGAEFRLFDKILLWAWVE